MQLHLKRNVKISFQGRGSLISYLRAQRLIDKGCEGLLVIVVDTAKKTGPVVPDIHVIKKFACVFSEEVPGLPPTRGRVWD